MQLPQWLLLCHDLGLALTDHLAEALLMVSVYEHTQRRHKHACRMTLPQMLEALVCAAATSKHLPLPLPELPKRLSIVCDRARSVLRHDPARLFRHYLWGDERVLSLLHLHHPSLHELFALRGWGSRSIPLSQLDGLLLERELYGVWWVHPQGSKRVALSLHLGMVREAYVDSLEAFTEEKAAEADLGLSYEGAIECLARCAVALYGPLHLPRLHQTVECIIRNLLCGVSVEQSACEGWKEARHQHPSEPHMESMVANHGNPGLRKSPKRKPNMNPKASHKGSYAEKGSKSSGSDEGSGWSVDVEQHLPCDIFVELLDISMVFYPYHVCYVASLVAGASQKVANENSE
ncbi:MAG: hypothetical protein SGPRY_005078 [Prymnesium sp.]